MLWHQNGAKPLPLNSGVMAFLVSNSILLTWHHFWSLAPRVWHHDSLCSKSEAPKMKSNEHYELDPFPHLLRLNVDAISVSPKATKERNSQEEACKRGISHHLKKELPHLGSNVALEENLIKRFNIGMQKDKSGGISIPHEERIQL
ncbi:hypothetical protein Tco_0715189 [Tanacetum coccineum]